MRGWPLSLLAPPIIGVPTQFALLNIPSAWRKRLTDFVVALPDNRRVECEHFVVVTAIAEISDSLKRLCGRRQVDKSLKFFFW